MTTRDRRPLQCSLMAIKCRVMLRIMQQQSRYERRTSVAAADQTEQALEHSAMRQSGAFGTSKVKPPICC